MRGSRRGIMKMLRRNAWLWSLVVAVSGLNSAQATGPSLTVNSISMPPGATGTVTVSGTISGESTFGVNILVELVPQAGTTGTLEFTPEPPVDITQIGDPWPGVGLFDPFDTGSTFSATLNGSVDDNGSLVPASVTFDGALSGFPVVASGDASGVWDVVLATSVGSSDWQGLATKLVAGTVTIAAGTCSDDSQCDDGIDCTDDTCVASACVFTPNDSNCTDDGLFCNGAEVCDAALDCVSEGDPCELDEFCNETTDTCDECQVDGDCDDGVYCNGAETCASGSCQAGSDPCPGQLCDEGTDSCTDCLNAGDCDDGNVCTDDACVSGSCSYTNNTLSCDDGLQCTNADVCSGGTCSGTVIPGCDKCVTDADCDDGNPCTDETCPAGTCVVVFNTDPCDDGDACTTADTCASGLCVGGAPPNCDDSNVCTDDSCDSVLGCVNANNTDACDDGSACTTNDTCAGGSCVGGPAPDCDDGNPCTDDTCDPVLGCMNTNNTAPCDDGDACTANDTCAAGVCVGGAPPNCDDGNVCTDDSCDSVLGCVNANNTVSCDDGSACTTNDTCAGGSCVGGPPPDCDDGNVCTDDSCDPVLGCVNANNTASCDDGDACTTNDTCAGGACVGGAPPNCDDGNVCTDDSCDSVMGCVNTNNTASCDDGDACTTNDTCAGGSCVGGAPPNCDDGNICTDDSCDSVLGCVNANNTDPCDDGQYCTQTDACSGGACVGNSDPCPGQLCDETGDTCVDCFTAADCDDGVTCTDDTCVDGACVNTPNNANCADDGLYCNGDEVCDPVQDCVSTGSPCPVGEFCIESQDTCVECLVAANCDDGIDCTDDSCVNGICSNTPNDTNCADDGLFCNGPEVCDAVLDCVSAGDPCEAGELCDESTDSCGQCLVNADCDDGVACTDDACVLGFCSNTVNDSNCPDDGLFCTGIESCDPVLDCVSSGTPCQPGEICNDLIDQCLECEVGADCDDGVACTDNTCVNGTCVYVPNDGNCTDNGVFCDGAEVCDISLDCVSEGNPCEAGELCNETTDACVACIADTDCDDGVGCTDNVCVKGVCSYVPNNANCPDDGMFCNGAEICDAVLDCVSAGDPCPVGELCNETKDSCGDCVVDGDCDDGVDCTDDTCVAGGCVYTANNENCPDDGVFCNGTEFCDLKADCMSTGDPCMAGELCNESTDTCGECIFDSDCDDGISCTDDGCVAGTCVYDVNNANCPDDGLFCNGTESCDAVLDCVSSGDPCGGGELCDESTDTCGECLVDGDCNDGVGCTDDSCVSGSCVYTANDSLCPDDGQFCNGVESCDAVLDCVSSGDPCMPGELCNEVTNTCGECLVNGDCDDGVACTDNFCVSGSCVFTVNNANCTDDGVFCNGPEICDAVNDCVSAGDPCEPGELCDEANDSCGECVVDADCDDGVFCNGAETCVGGGCQAGSDPCPGQLCDEVTDTCVECLGDNDCDDGNDCTFNFCNSGTCSYPNVVDGVTCGGSPNGLCDLQDTCLSGVCQDNVRSVGTSCRSATNECDVAETCDGINPACPADEFVANGVTCTDDGNECTSDTCFNGTCSHDALNDGTTCGGSPNGLCDLQDTCMSGVCQDNVRAAGNTCRPPANECDSAEMCDGLLPECPPDSFQPAGTLCTDDLNECTDDVCDGAGTCGHPPVNDGTVCGNSPSGDCDAQDTCQSGSCVDNVQPDTFVCRPAFNECDVADTCNGVLKSCPANAFVEAGTVCTDDNNDCTSDICNGTGSCIHPSLANGTACTDDANDCTGDICVNGSCVHPALASGTACGDPTDSICDNPDTCNSSGVCLANAEPSGIACGDQTSSVCDNPDTCDGLGACSPNAVPAGVICGDPTDTECDQADACDGLGMCSPNILPLGSPCGDPSDTFCTDPDTCDGNGNCLANDFVCPPGRICFNSVSGAACVECIVDEDCDDGVFCNGTEICDGFFCLAGTSPCDDDNVCTEDQCNETTGACNNVPDNSVDPDDGIFCNGVDQCINGVLIIAGDETCDDGNACTTGVCDVGLDECVYSDVPGGCDDNDACTEGDVCSNGVCTGVIPMGNGEINLNWSPSAPIVEPGETFQIGLLAVSADQTPASCSSISTILQWDPTKIELLGRINNGPYTWQLSTFPNDSNQDGLNDTWLDGDAYYTAWSVPSNLPVIPFSGLLVTTFEFRALEAVSQTPLEIPLCTGDAPTRTVIDFGVFGNQTGILSTALIRVSECISAADCDDGLFCNGSEACLQGVCLEGDPPCEDGNLCTDDVCSDVSDTCQNIGLTGDFDQDGIFCNGVDRCESGIFVPGTPPNCNDGNICTNDSCNEAMEMCVNAANTNACDDGNACTVNDVCTGGTCIGEVNPSCTTCDTAAECDDGIACTADLCVPPGFCENTPNNSLCVDDGLFCTGQEICNPSKGDPVTGCLSTGTPCPDCTEVDGCPCVAPVAVAAGGRYIAIDPQSVGTDGPSAFIFSYCADAFVRYVGPLPGESGAVPFDNNNDGLVDGTLAALVDDPADALYLTPSGWGDTLWVISDDIVPEREYQIQTDCGPPGSPNVTQPVTIETWVWGDVDNNSVVNFDDILLIVIAFQGEFNPDPGPQGLANLDLSDCLPSRTINFADIFRAVTAFQQRPYDEGPKGACFEPCSVSIP